MATKNSLGQQVLYKLNGRESRPSDAVQLSDVVLAVGQIANYLLKGSWFDGTKMGERIPENLMIATYPKQGLTSFGGKKSKCTLPAMPVGLPLNMGVLEVSIKEDFSCLLIPLQAGQSDLLKSADVISDLLGQVGYEVYGNQIITTRDLTIDNVDGLYLRLAVTDVSSLGDYDILPIAADMEAQIVQQLYEQFAGIQQQPGTVDAYAANTQSAKQ